MSRYRSSLDRWTRMMGTLEEAEKRAEAAGEPPVRPLVSQRRATRRLWRMFGRQPR